MKGQDTRDFVQTVVRSGGKYLMAKRSKDGYWEFMGGKLKSGEKLRQAAIRELNAETDLNLEEEDIIDFRGGDSYRSDEDKIFRLNPVFFKISEDKKQGMSKEGLSDEHTDFEWINLTEFDKYSSKEQYQALEQLKIVNGRVALAAVKKSGRFLFVERSPENSTPGRWGFVSGEIEPGENPEEAAVRELKEETGLKAKPLSKGEYYIGKGEKGYWRLEPVHLKYISGKVDLNWELSEYKWIQPREIADFKNLRNDKASEKLGLV